MLAKRAPAIWDRYPPRQSTLDNEMSFNDGSLLQYRLPGIKVGRASILYYDMYKPWAKESATEQSKNSVTSSPRHVHSCFPTKRDVSPTWA